MFAQVLKATCSVYSPSRSKNTKNVVERKIAQQVLYKTEMCRLLIEKGHCSFGDRCNFAHCESELRPKICHPKFKSDKCRSFHEDGYCPYGSRCRFDHSSRHSSAPTKPTSSNIPSVCMLGPSSLIVFPDPQNDDQINRLGNVEKYSKRLPLFERLCSSLPQGCTLI
ncbi:hypothetical protein P9112_002089 [Eukaryota sp. TZLM1-RC]